MALEMELVGSKWEEVAEADPSGQGTLTLIWKKPAKLRIKK